MIQLKVWLLELVHRVGNEEVEECPAQRPGMMTNVLEVTKKDSTEGEAGV